MTYVDHDFRRKGYGTKIVRELLSAHQAAHGPKKFHACCIETKFFVGCGIKHMTAMIPVKLSWKENLRKSNEQSTQKAV
jgi:GNAT superfamily N-acetyltransferase